MCKAPQKLVVKPCWEIFGCTGERDGGEEDRHNRHYYGIGRAAASLPETENTCFREEGVRKILKKRTLAQAEWVEVAWEAVSSNSLNSALSLLRNCYRKLRVVFLTNNLREITSKKRLKNRLQVSVKGSI